MLATAAPPGLLPDKPQSAATVCGQGHRVCPFLTMRHRACLPPLPPFVKWVGAGHEITVFRFKLKFMEV